MRHFLPVLLLLAAAWAASPADPGLVLLAGGDVTLGYHLPEYLEEQAAAGMEKEEQWHYPFRRLAEVTRAADLFVVNLEGALTTAQEELEKSFNFKAPPGYVAVLQAAGVDAVSLANNHALDYHWEGLAETRAVLAAAGIAAFGAGRDLAEARRPAILERRGVRVGFLGYLYLGDHTIEPESLYAGPGRPGVAGTHKDQATLAAWVAEDVAALAGRVDLVVVMFHWGREGTPLLEPYQRPLARAAVAAGADLVIGHHAHALQGLEAMGESWVAYGLGNLVFGGNWSPRVKEAALLQARLRKGAMQVDVLPIRVDGMPAGEPFQPRWLEGDAAEEVRRLLPCWAGAARLEDCAPADAEVAGSGYEEPGP